MSTSEWEGTVVKKFRALLDGANIYRRLRIRRDDGQTITVRVDRATWKELSVGDRVSNTAGGRFVKDVGRE
ncbi:hypothetical protein [Mycolicibacterium sp. NCC-Tsukiji]|uniref:DUF7489 domain-containing protein n=1 Tax=Mycolicibacterium sp. NCC-Tsukiji TaxID=2185272 RepID=UPI000ED3536F|nr:hypothetical protein [Mycolicibacterium sp. NCC-Tsukiji]GCA98449.1 hypothetical protein NCCNTM_20840 [Mycolicibacterium sp. NCC-Tsukiji]